MPLLPAGLQFFFVVYALFAVFCRRFSIYWMFCVCKFFFDGNININRHFFRHVHYLCSVCVCTVSQGKKNTNTETIQLVGVYFLVNRLLQKNSVCVRLNYTWCGIPSINGTWRRVFFTKSVKESVKGEFSVHGRHAFCSKSDCHWL